MSKPKKSKVISLVSDYAEDEDSNESAAESEASEDESEQESVGSQPGSAPQRPDVNAGADESSKSPRTGAEGGQTAASEAASEAGAGEAGQSDDAKQENEEIEAALKIKYTLENGFPPGCDQIKLPPAPRAPCSQTLQTKIIQVVERMEKYGYSINDDIERKKKFRNPSIYEKLIDAYEIDEYGSNFPTYEDLKSQNYMFYDELDKVQQEEWARREKERKERTKIEMVSGTKKKV